VPDLGCEQDAERQFMPPCDCLMWAQAGVRPGMCWRRRTSSIFQWRRTL
jgi:hypothetical protein